MALTVEKQSTGHRIVVLQPPRPTWWARWSRDYDARLIRWNLDYEAWNRPSTLWGHIHFQVCSPLATVAAMFLIVIPAGLALIEWTIRAPFRWTWAHMYGRDLIIDIRVMDLQMNGLTSKEYGPPRRTRVSWPWVWESSSARPRPLTWSLTLGDLSGFGPATDLEWDEDTEEKTLRYPRDLTITPPKGSAIQFPAILASDAECRQLEEWLSRARDEAQERYGRGEQEVPHHLRRK